MCPKSWIQIKHHKPTEMNAVGRTALERRRKSRGSRKTYNLTKKIHEMLQLIYGDGSMYNFQLSHPFK